MYLRRNSSGFTLIELLVVVVVIGVLTSLVITLFTNVRDQAYYNRALEEFRVMRIALERYRIEHGDYPPDVDRDIPPGIESYIQGADAQDWPDAPWPGSVYDWDVYENEGQTAYQISIRFCPIGDPDGCTFPKEDWASDFGIDSSVYYCMEGNCKSHPERSQDYPGRCVNCSNP